MTPATATAAQSVPPFALHPAAWAGVLACCALFAWWLRDPRHRATRGQVWSFVAAMAALLAATTWPLAGLAAHRLLVALVVQRLLLLLAVPPLLLAAVPRPLVASLTRPAFLDALARVCSRPAPAVAIVTAVAMGTLNVPAVVLQSHSAVARGGFDLLVLGAGIVLWMPVLRPVPATGAGSALARAGYLVVQSIVPSFLSVVWIFARHPLYPPYAHERAFSLSPLADQELSGFVAKLGTIVVLWTVAFVVVMKAERVAEHGGDPEPLTWADVERELERVARRERQGGGARPKSG
ncbi:MAG: cytochrome c oxidase assembly protein [Actinomycetota bacterium]|nr:cytochrome c oxidase assembly protein [Actinomycetota bacterium]